MHTGLYRNADGITDTVTWRRNTFYLSIKRNLKENLQDIRFKKVNIERIYERKKNEKGLNDHKTHMPSKKILYYLKNSLVAFHRMIRFPLDLGFKTVVAGF